MRKRARKDSGFALLLVFLMAAMIAISLYMEMPRVAMESQRQKEQLLIGRGEQYQRAIQVFFKTNNRWPTKIEDLESFNNRRFLRRRFIDPMTGKDEWRLIHMVNGILTDSLNTKLKPADPNQKPVESAAGQYVGQTGGMFNTGADATGTAGPALGRRRLSDGGAGGGMIVSMDPGAGGASNGNAIGAPPVPGSPTGGTPGDNSGVPPTGAAPGTNPQDGSQPNPAAPGMPIMPPGMPPGMPGMPPGIPGAPVNSQTGGVSASPYPTIPGSNGMPPGFPQPGATATGANSAQGMIQQLLTSPRPGGAPIGTATTGGMVIGGGIAGVASKADQESIMVYTDQTNYKQWEFIFDPAKMRPPPNPLAGAGGANGTPASQMGSLPQTQNGTSVNDIVAQQNGTATSTSGATGATGAIGATGTTGVAKQ